MERVVLYRVWYFEDTRHGERFYFEDKASCEEARFCVYKSYDGERISKNNFVVPVTQAKSMLINEDFLSKINLQKGTKEEGFEPGE